MLAPQSTAPLSPTVWVMPLLVFLQSKMQLLMAGVEEKKAEEIARIKKEAEFDYRLLLRKYVRLLFYC